MTQALTDILHKMPRKHRGPHLKIMPHIRPPHHILDNQRLYTSAICFFFGNKATSELNHFGLDCVCGFVFSNLYPPWYWWMSYTLLEINKYKIKKKFQGPIVCNDLENKEDKLSF